MGKSAAALLWLSVLGLTLIALSTPSDGQVHRGVRRVAEIADPNNGFDDQFGYSVALSGNILVVGEPQEAGPTGLAFVFLNSGGTWAEAANLTSGSSETIMFGTSVAIGEGVIAVATPAQGNNNANGEVCVFVKPPGGWRGDLTPTAVLTLPGVTNNLLGTSVAVSSDGTTVAAGGPGEGGPSGVYVFVEPPGGWVSTTEPTATLAPSSGFEVGHAVAMSGNTVVAGEANTGNFEKAYVFVEPPGGWVSTTEPTATLTASDENFIDGFGSSVAISGNTIAIGSPGHGAGGKPGAAYVFIEPPTGWADMTQTAELNVQTGQILELGTSVAVWGNVVLVGAPWDIIGTNDEQGAVYGYTKPASGWVNSTSPNGSVTAKPGMAQERFGDSIATSGKTFVVGAPYDGGALQGAVYIFAVQ
jgi:hypothetical protein